MASNRRVSRRHSGFLFWLGLVFVGALLASCGGGSAPPPTLAQRSDVVEIGAQAGITPFISFVQFRGESLAALASVHYSISPKPGTASRPVDVTYAIAALQRRGYTSTERGLVTVPVFGLYDAYDNQVHFDLAFEDQSTQALDITITTAPYTDPSGIYGHPTVLVQRTPGSELGFDFFAMKSWYGTPVVVDTDGALRWVGAGVGSSMASLYQDNGFVVGDTGAPGLTRLEFDGTSQQTTLVTSRVTHFHHNLDPGKVGILGNVDILSGGVQDIESSLIEFGHSGVVLREWDFAAILRDYMQSQGDDPSSFVRSGYDWFHMNAAAYDARDDSITVSSRENFVIKVDYSTGRILWILGDPAKYWYTFASLRAKALTLEAGGLYPIGQHATSITSDGLLMLFNNGWQSFNQPVGAPTGESRSYSAVSTYRIDDQARAAREVWRFDYAQTVQSIVCSSAYEAEGKSLLVSYAFAGGGTQARLVGLDSNQRVVFDLQYPNTPACNTSWNAVPVPLGQMHFD